MGGSGGGGFVIDTATLVLVLLAVAVLGGIWICPLPAATVIHGS